MKNKKLIILFLITLSVILVAGITAKIRAPQKSLEKITLFPELGKQINNVSRIVIRGNNKTVELKQQDKNWVIASSDNYPALFNKVRETVLNMANLAIVDKKTDNPDLYSRLGVEGPDVKDTTSLLITLYDRKNQASASLIVGNPRQSSSSKPGLYVRKPDEKTALLVEGTLKISADPIDWFQKELFDIPQDRVKNIKIHFADGSDYETYKENPAQADFQIRGKSEEDINNKSATRVILNRLANGLQEMRADGVVAANKFTFPDDTILTTVTTFDGLVINAKLANVDNKTFANFTFDTNPELVAKITKAGKNETTDLDTGAQKKKVDMNELAQSMNNGLSKWVYQIPDYKYEALTTSPDTIRKLMENIPKK